MTNAALTMIVNRESKVELEAEIWCPGCRALYGRIFRKQLTEAVYEHVTEPATIPKYCGVCERPTERKA